MFEIDKQALLERVKGDKEVNHYLALCKEAIRAAQGPSVKGVYVTKRRLFDYILGLPPSEHIELIVVIGEHDTLDHYIINRELFEGFGKRSVTIKKNLISFGHDDISLIFTLVRKGKPKLSINYCSTSSTLPPWPIKIEEVYYDGEDVLGSGLDDFCLREEGITRWSDFVIKQCIEYASLGIPIELKLISTLANRFTKVFDLDELININGGYQYLITLFEHFPRYIERISPKALLELRDKPDFPKMNIVKR